MKDITTAIRAAFKGKVPRAGYSVRARSGSKITCDLSDAATAADALEIIARVWFSEKHSWYYLSAYFRGRCVFSGLSDGVIPEHVKLAIDGIRAQVDA